MAIPDFQSMIPLLRFAADGAEHSVAESRSPLGDQFGLTDDERAELLPSGQQSRFNNRVAWAKVYLERAGLVAKTRRGHFKITPRGTEVLADPPERIDISFLKRFPEFDDFRAKPTEPPGVETVDDETPEETLQAAYQTIRDTLASEILAMVKASPPCFFERLVLDLMLKMGYGGSREKAGSLTNEGADAGIDGIINEDQLGLDVIYLQAKRSENTVGRPEIHRFSGLCTVRPCEEGRLSETSTSLTMRSSTSQALIRRWC